MGLYIASPAHQIKSIRYAHNAAVTTAPKLMLIGGKCVVALNKSAADEVNSYVIEAHLKGAAKATGEAWTINAALYWDNSNSRFTTTSSGNTLAGYAAAVAASGDTTGEVNLISLNP